MKDPKQVLVDKIESQLGITATLLKELKKLVADMPDEASEVQSLATKSMPYVYTAPDGNKYEVKRYDAFTEEAE